MLLLLEEEIKFITQHGRTINQSWGGDWTTGTCDHNNFEKKTHDLHVNVLQHSYTDMFFRNIQHIINTEKIIFTDVTDKLWVRQVTKIPNYVVIKHLLRKFVEENDEFKCL